MILGVIIGTYSSMFVASPVLKFLKVSFKTLEKMMKIKLIKVIISTNSVQLPLLTTLVMKGEYLF